MIIEETPYPKGEGVGTWLDIFFKLEFGKTDPSLQYCFPE